MQFYSGTLLFMDYGHLIKDLVFVVDVVCTGCHFSFNEVTCTTYFSGILISFYLVSLITVYTSAMDEIGRINFEGY